MPTFDVTSEVDMQEVRNAVDQAAREVGQRYDFKGTNSTIDLGETAIAMATASEDRLNALKQVLEEKLVKRKVSLKVLDYGKVEDASGGTVRQEAAITAGINSDKARDINKFIKGHGNRCGFLSETQAFVFFLEFRYAAASVGQARAATRPGRVNAGINVQRQLIALGAPG